MFFLDAIRLALDQDSWCKLLLGGKHEAEVKSAGKNSTDLRQIRDIIKGPCVVTHTFNPSTLGG